MADNLNNPSIELSPNSFDSLAQSRSRWIRAASLAIPNGTIIDLLDEEKPTKFNLSPPSASSINIRRHSSHHCQIIDKVSEEQKRLQTLPVLPSAVALPIIKQPIVESVTPLATPPPVPKRSFQKQGDIVDGHSNQFSPLLLGDAPTSSPVLRQNSKRREAAMLAASIKQADCPTVIENGLINMDSPVFLDKEPSVAKYFGPSNRSSSDSNKSHQTNDSSGYMTASTVEADHIFFGEGTDVFRTRFSSVDTQSSMDSCSDITKCPSPPSSCDISFNKNASLANSRPPVPKRRQTTVAGFPKIPPPTVHKSGGRSRGIPPIPPARSQNSSDSPRMLQNGNNARFFTNGAHEMLNKPMAKGKQSKFAQHSRPTQRQDSNISSDSYSMTSSPGYNTKSMEMPLLQHAARINKTTQESLDSASSDLRRLRQNCAASRQDSNISSDSFSLTSSPGYNTKLIETPLIAHSDKLHTIDNYSAKPPHLITGQPPIGRQMQISEVCDSISPPENSPITKSASTPASLQTIVRFQNGSHLSLHHKVVNRRKSSSPLISHPKLNCRSLQLITNALVIVTVLIGLGVFLYAETVSSSRREEERRLREDKSLEKPTLQYVHPIDLNPAPGVCLPIIVKFCESAPYNFTVFPNYIGHFGQLDAEEELEGYEALVDVKCYDLVSLFLCSIFAPKCGSTGLAVAPCKSLCLETIRRCGFFFDVFGLGLPDYLNCNILADSPDSDMCVGFQEVQEARLREQKPACSGFMCDQKRCIPSDWRCDGHVDCQDQADESECSFCGPGEIYCGEKRCMSQIHVCDGIVNCPNGQDERNCVRLSDRSGDVGKGTLEVFKPQIKEWVPACVGVWDPATSPMEACTMLGYSSVNSSRLSMRKTHMIINPTVDPPAIWRMHQKHRNLVKDFNSCPVHTNYKMVNLTCSNYECGKIRTQQMMNTPRKRIVGGKASSPGDWPFIAAILGGPEEIFYCAGVLIADQWVLTASHCVGNHTLRNINDWTIQLGITRRHSHSYYGEKVKIQRVIPHPQYNSEITHDNDIALFQLATRVAFHEHILPVCLPPADMKELEPGTFCTVIGWGKKELRKGSAAYEPTVNEVQVPVLNRELCNEWLVQLNVTEGMICAGYIEGGRDACQGDSGGPLLCRDSHEPDRWFVGGIVSWGVKCAHPKLPGVYANVPKYIPWIKQQMQRYSNDYEEEQEQSHEYGIRRDYDNKIRYSRREH